MHSFKVITQESAESFVQSMKNKNRLREKQLSCRLTLAYSYSATSQSRATMITSDAKQLSRTNLGHL